MSEAVTHAYHTTAAGHKVLLDLVHGDRAGPVLISFHGGGIVHGSRRDAYVPGPIDNAWPGAQILADYRFLIPSSGVDIYEDVSALFEFLPTILTPSQLGHLFVTGFSGGGYPARLAAIVAADKLRGVVSFYGMGGDFLLDYWLTPRKANPEDTRTIEQIQKESAAAVERLKKAPEVSDSSYIEGAPTHQPNRGVVWDYFHAHGVLPDLIGGVDLSKLRAASREEREGLIPQHARKAFPQLYMRGKLPPLLLVHGTADQAVPYEESLHTLETVKAAGGRVELKSVPGGNHGLEVGGSTKEADAAYTYALQWMLALD